MYKHFSLCHRCVWSTPLIKDTYLCNRQSPVQKITTKQMQSCETRSQWLHLQNTCIPTAQETLWKRGWKDCKSQRDRGFALKVCVLVTSEAAHSWSLTNQTAQMWTEQERSKWIFQTGWGKAHKASTPRKELWATQERWGWERRSFLAKTTPTACPVSNGQSWNHTYR